MELCFVIDRGLLCVRDKEVKELSQLGGFLTSEGLHFGKKF